MAAAVDSFSLLYREASSCLSRWFEPLVVVGALYACGRALVLLRGACTMLRVHALPRVLAGPPLRERYGAWAVLLGSSSEVCRAYAEELARRGVNILLIVQSGEEEEEEEGEEESSLARSQSEESSHARSLRRSLQQRHPGVEVEVVRVEDLSLLGHGAARSKPVLLALRDKDVGLLVCCLDPALEEAQDLVDQSEEALWRAVGTNVALASLLARWVLPGMVERARGAVVLMSSGGPRFLPAGGSVMLASTCGYMEQFSRALHHEYGPRGVFVQSLIPFQVSSSGALGWLVPTPEIYARHAITTLGLSHHTTGYWLHALQYGVMCCVPEWIWLLGSRVFLTLT